MKPFLCQMSRGSGVQRFRSSWGAGVQGFRGSGFQDFRGSGVQRFRGSWGSGVQGLSGAGVRGSGVQGWIIASRRDQRIWLMFVSLLRKLMRMCQGVRLGNFASLGSHVSPHMCRLAGGLWRGHMCPNPYVPKHGQEVWADQTFIRWSVWAEDKSQ